jgi:hypothetical protein
MQIGGSMRGVWKKSGSSARGRSLVGPVLVGGLAISGTLGGCGLAGGLAGGLSGDMAESLGTVREEAERAHAAIEADRAALVREAERFSDASPERARFEGLIAERSAQAEAFERAIGRLDEARARAIAAGDDPAGTLEEGAAWLAPLVPPGAQLPLLLGAGLAASVWRAVRLKQSAASIAEGLEKAMRGDEALREGVQRNAATIRSVQTKTAQRIVDEVQKNKVMVRLPI